MPFFQDLMDSIPNKAVLNLTIRKDEGIIVVIVVPKVNNDALPPFIIRGEPGELDTMFLGVMSEIKEPLEDYTYFSDLDGYKKNIEKKTSALAKKTEGVSKEDRLKEPLKEDDKKWLISTPSSDGNFKSVIKRASLETLKAAWEEVEESKRKQIGAEIKRLTGKPLEDSVVVEKQQTLF